MTDLATELAAIRAELAELRRRLDDSDARQDARVAFEERWRPK